MLPWTSTLLPVLAAAGTLLSAVLLAFALRGRRIDDHPVCRRCRFDLAGVYPAPVGPDASPPSSPSRPSSPGAAGAKNEGGSARSKHAAACPECGADLSSPRAVRLGQRRTRRGMLLAAALLLLVSAGLGGVWGWGRATNFDWNTVKPAWILVREARAGANADWGTGEGTGVGPVIAELDRRLKDGRLTERTITELVAIALEVQGDRDRPWTRQWAVFLESARAAGHLSPEQTGRYFRQGTVASLQFRSRVRAGEAWPLGIRLRFDRCGDADDVWARPWLDRLETGGKELDHGWPREPSSIAGLSSNGSVIISRETALPMQPGEHTLRASFVIQVVEGIEEPTQLAQWTVEVEKDLVVLPADAALLTPIDDPSLAEKIRKGVRIDAARAGRNNEGKAWASGSIMLENMPAPTAFEIYWKDGDREWLVGTIATRPGMSTGTAYGPSPIGDFRADRVTLVFRSSLRVAEESLDLQAYWRGEVKVPDVPVRWVEPE